MLVRQIRQVLSSKIVCHDADCAQAHVIAVKDMHAGVTRIYNRKEGITINTHIVISVQPRETVQNSYQIWFKCHFRASKCASCVVYVMLSPLRRTHLDRYDWSKSNELIGNDRAWRPELQVKLQSFVTKLHPGRIKAKYFGWIPEILVIRPNYS